MGHSRESCDGCCSSTVIILQNQGHTATVTFVSFSKTLVDLSTITLRIITLDSQHNDSQNNATE